MCGILGIKKIKLNMLEIAEEKGYNTNEIHNLMIENSKRGTSVAVMFETPQGTFMHFRAPTSGCDLNNLSEAYPLTYKGWGLIGNGVISQSFFEYIKTEDNNNDLYYILKNTTLDNTHIQLNFKYLEQVDGLYALVFFNPNGNIYLVKNQFPIYYNDDIFSSVPFKGSKLLEDGIVWDWTNNKEFCKIKTKESPFNI